MLLHNESFVSLELLSVKTFLIMECHRNEMNEIIHKISCSCSNDENKNGRERKSTRITEY